MPKSHLDLLNFRNVAKYQTKPNHKDCIGVVLVFFRSKSQGNTASVNYYEIGLEIQIEIFFPVHKHKYVDCDLYVQNISIYRENTVIKVN